MPDTEELTPETIMRIMYSIVTQQQRERFEETLELDFSYALPGRGPVPRQPLPAARLARRGLPGDPLRDQEPRVPRACPRRWATSRSCPAASCSSPGPTGSGKSTTLAALVDLANRTRNEHIMTVEDPIEFLHQHKSCLVNQREVGEDTYSFAERPQARAAPGPGHHPGRRDARPGDDPGGADRRRDRPPRLRHAAHPGRRADDRPRHRRLPAAASSSRSASSWPAPCRGSSARRCARPPTAAAGWPPPRC